MRAAALFLLAGLASPSLATSEAPADNGMSLVQFQAQLRQRLMAVDTDHDGTLSEAELVAARGATDGTAGGSATRRDPARLFKRLDANGDGKLDPSEIDAMSARRFARLDANGDGVVTAEERRTGRMALREGGMGRRGLGWGHGADGYPRSDGQPGGGADGLGGQPGD